MESLEEVIRKCEKAELHILSQSNRDAENYDKDLFARSVRDFLENIMLCMRLTSTIQSGERFSNWWRLFWDLCTIHPDIQVFEKENLLAILFVKIMEETVTWKLKYLLLTVVHFTIYSIPDTCYFLRSLIILMRSALQYPEQQTYYEVILEMFDVHDFTVYDYLLNTIAENLSDNTDIIDSKLLLTDGALYSRFLLNRLNRQSNSLVIYSVQCVEVDLLFKKLLTPLKLGKLWIDFNLKAETITIICQRSCLRSERPSTDSEEFDDCTSEVLTINFAHIDKITAKVWPHKKNLQARLLTFVLNKVPRYIYDSSCTVVEKSNKLFLTVEEREESYRLFDLLCVIFTTRFQMLGNKPERKASEQSTSESRELALLPYPYPRVCLSHSGSTIHIEDTTELPTVQDTDTDKPERDESHDKNTELVKALQPLIILYNKAVDENHACVSEEQKEGIQRLYDIADCFKNSEQIRSKLMARYGTFLRDN